MTLDTHFPSEEDAVELLEETVSLWVTIRGVSLAGTWMEVYKQETKKNYKEVKGTKFFSESL